MHRILIFTLALIALIIIYLDVKANMLPPILTGIGFIIIAVLRVYKPKA